MKDTRDMINAICNEMWQKITSRLNDQDDDFTYSYSHYDGMDVLSGKFVWWLKGNAMFLQHQLDENEGELTLEDFDRICEVIGKTYIQQLIGERIVDNLVKALKEEKYEIDRLYDGGDKDDKCRA